MEKLERFGPIRRCFFVALCCVLVFMCSLGWNVMKNKPWHPRNIFVCDKRPAEKIVFPQIEKPDVRLERRPAEKIVFPQIEKPDVRLERMLYPKPETLKPPRTDVLTLTPWLAPIVWNGIFNSDILNAQFHKRGVRIGITTFAIKKYTRFLKDFLETGEKFFMVGHKVNYYIFTDRAQDIPNVTLGEGRHIHIINVTAYQRWQDVTMRRMQMIRDQLYTRFIHEVDYLVCVDVDMRFYGSVGVEILGDVFGTLHPGFFGASRAQFTYDRNPKSVACIPVDEGDFYYAGGYFGGIIDEVYKLTNYCHNAMMTDKAIGIEALWHDESYLNKYFLNYKPKKVLSPEYVWNDYYGSPRAVQIKRFIGVDKNYAEVRFRR